MLVIDVGGRGQLSRNAEEEDVLKGLAISLKVICEKVKFRIMIFAVIFVIMNGHTCKLFKSLLNDDRSNQGQWGDKYGLT